MGGLLDKLFSGSMMKKLATIIFVFFVIIGIIFGLVTAKTMGSYTILCILIGAISGGIVGLLFSFSMHVLGQILDNLERIRNSAERIESGISSN